MATINGEMKDVRGMTVKEYLMAENYELTRIVVERNEEIVPKAEYENTVIADDDTIEIVSFVGGG